MAEGEDLQIALKQALEERDTQKVYKLYQAGAKLDEFTARQYCA